MRIIRESDEYDFDSDHLRLNIVDELNLPALKAIVAFLNSHPDVDELTDCRKHPEYHAPFLGGKRVTLALEISGKDIKDLRNVIAPFLPNVAKQIDAMIAEYANG